jgi:3-hexulose-6-phosphate synthase
MAKPLIQLALDSLDYDTTVKLAQVAHRYVDIIEIGTPCVKVNGLKLVKDLKARFPKQQILADLKTMDAGYYEAEPFFAAGAAITTVLGTSDLDTIKGVIAVANKYGAKAQVDLINVADKAGVAKAAAAAGAHIIGIHTGIDQQIAGHTPFADLEALLALNLDALVSVAGGIKAATVAQVVKAGANIIVVGGAITGAKDPGKAAAEIRSLVDAAAGA